jgi:hypothetical protein
MESRQVSGTRPLPFLFCCFNVSFEELIRTEENAESSIALELEIFRDSSSPRGQFFRSPYMQDNPRSSCFATTTSQSTWRPF